MDSLANDHGAHFFRCDLQVHTPRDADWNGKRPSSDSARRDYADVFIAACRAANLEAVAITDHHDFAFFPYIRAAALAETSDDGSPLPQNEQVIVFPGIELTLAVPCQALLVLDADFPEDRLLDVLKCLNIDAVDAAADRLPATTSLDQFASLKDLHELLDEREWLKGRYIILPNATDGGYKTLLRTGMHTKYKEMPCVGCYLDGSVDSLGRGNRDILAGKTKAWGNKRSAVFQTSDARSADFSALGAHSTWVKWATPTAEALRQACLAEESRIAQTAPLLPSVWVSQLVVSNSRFMGPIDLAFNSQYNAIIGGRGTGKSTILGYLRWALCDQPAIGGADEEAADPSARQRRLIDATLVPFGAQVEVYFTINGIAHVVRRHAQDGEVLLKVGDGDFGPARESDIRALLPIHAYSQKQLSSVSVRVDELTRFVTAPIQKRLDDIDQRVGELAGRLRENYATLQRFRLVEATISRTVMKERSLSEQAASMRKALTGLSAEDQKLLVLKPKIDVLRDAVALWDQQLEDVQAAAREVEKSADDSLARLSALDDMPSPLGRSAENLRAETARVLTEFRDAARAALADLESGVGGGSSRDKARAKVLAEATKFDDAYEVVKAKSTAHEARLAELASLEKQQSEATKELQRQRRELDSLGDPRGTHASLRQGFVRLLAERSKCLDEQCSQLTKLSEGLLRASLRRGQGLRDVGDRFRTLVAGSGVRTAKIESLFAALGQESDPISTWETLLDELEGLLLVDPDSELTSETTPVLTRLGLTVADQKRILPKISPDSWLDLALTPITDQPAFEYRVKEEDFVEFAVASAGQQATALLRVLLAQTGMPLLIDQPEDDLDSPVIQDVVQRIWTAKSRRQLLFASHNANLVVNGDAELVAACDYRSAGDQSGGKISLEGAIDMPSIRDEITRVMEGGEKAFKLRKAKYGF